MNNLTANIIDIGIRSTGKGLSHNNKIYYDWNGALSALKFDEYLVD